MSSEPGRVGSAFAPAQPGDPQEEKTGPGWLAQSPVLLLAVAIVSCRLAGLNDVYSHDALRLLLSSTFYTLVSLGTLLLVARSFLASGAVGLLLLECGVVLWSLAGTVGDLVFHGDANINATIFNVSILLAALCHLAGAVLTTKPRPPLGARMQWLAAGIALALAALGLVTWAALAGRLPVFFVQGQGGTPVRYGVLAAAIATFLLSAVLLRAGGRARIRFVSWYSLALLSMSVGLFGITIQTSLGGIVNWLSRTAQWLGGVYLLAAAVASVRETGSWRLSLDAAELDRQASIWDDRLLRALTPWRLYSLSAAWRYPLAVAFVAAATALRWALVPWMGMAVPYNVALLAVMGATLLLGVGPGLLSVLLSDIGVELFVLRSLPAGVAEVTVLRLSFSLAVGVFIVGVFHAIRSAQIASRQSEARYSGFAAATFEGIAESDAGRIVDCNEQFGQLTGYTSSELKGTLITDLLAPEDRERAAATIRENRDSVGEYTALRVDGARIVLEARGRPSAPDSARRFTVVRDVTARKEMESERVRIAQQHQEALRQLNAELERRVADRTAELVVAAKGIKAERQRFLDVLDTLPVIVHILRPDRRMEWANRACREAVGNSQGYLCFAKWLGRSEPCEGCQAFVPLETGRPHNWEWTLPDGRTFDVYNFPFPDADGSPMVLSMEIEITERRRNDRALAERTALIEHQADQLRALATELAQAEQRERQRLAKILHDNIQQLLVAAQIQLDLITRADPAALRSTLHGMDRILAETMEASRSLTVELCPPVLHQSGLAAALSWLAARLDEQQQFTVHLRATNDAEPSGPDERAFLFEATREILLNAAKHSGTREARVTMMRGGDDCCRIIVEDDGQGFDPASVKPGPSGGFGLFSIQQRLLYLGGTLEIESAPARGTRAVLAIPIRPHAGPDAAPGTASTEGVTAQVSFRQRARKISVLLVDDHKLMRQGLTSLLQFESDIEIVAEAENGEQALQAARQHEPDVVIMDVNMPVMNGIDATRRLLKEAPGTRVIALSMDHDADAADAMREAGAVAYLTKGGPSDDLMAAIRACASVTDGNGAS